MRPVAVKTRDAASSARWRVSPWKTSRAIDVAAYKCEACGTRVAGGGGGDRGLARGAQCTGYGTRRRSEGSPATRDTLFTRGPHGTIVAG